MKNTQQHLGNKANLTAQKHQPCSQASFSLSHDVILDLSVNSPWYQTIVLLVICLKVGNHDFDNSISTPQGLDMQRMRLSLSVSRVYLVILVSS